MPLTSVQDPNLQKAACGARAVVVVVVSGGAVGQDPMKQDRVSWGRLLASHAESSSREVLTRHFTARMLTPFSHVTEHCGHNTVSEPERETLLLNVHGGE